MHLSTLKTGFSHQKQELNLWNRLAAVMHIGLNPEEDSDTSDYGLGFGSPAAPWNRGMDSIGSVIFSVKTYNHFPSTQLKPSRHFQVVSRPSSRRDPYVQFTMCVARS